ncbi:MAG: glycosyltransferase family 2 protein [Acidobacteriota bacterium]|nr:MAG: glycosyltransferase family 2 protein [Acidobacteriota bacterium]
MNHEEQKIPDLSVVIVSFNTKALLRECLETLYRESEGLDCEVFVVDNKSKDGSPAMVAEEFPAVRLFEPGCNLGFAAANNVAFREATGRYVVLLNSDAFLKPGALQKSIERMDANPRVGLAGGLLVGRDGSWQPSARMFPSLLNELLNISGLAAKYSKSRFFGRFDRTFADPREAAEVDWVPGAFSIIRRSVLGEIGHFDEDFFLYYEEVDLCRRIKRAGYSIWYWPEIEVIHIGGESSRAVQHLSMSSAGSQLTLWRMRSELLYYRKNHGALTAWLAMKLEMLWHQLRLFKNRSKADAEAKMQGSQETVRLLKQAWQETSGGTVSPERPW